MNLALHYFDCFLWFHIFICKNKNFLQETTAVFSFHAVSLADFLVQSIIIPLFLKKIQMKNVQYDIFDI